jgi:hypothetical protein
MTVDHPSLLALRREHVVLTTLFLQAMKEVNMTQWRGKNTLTEIDVLGENLTYKGKT